MGTKLKKRLMFAKQDFKNKKTVDSPEENSHDVINRAKRKHKKTEMKYYINSKYYNLRVPGS